MRKSEVVHANRPNVSGGMVALIALPTIGLPAALDALRWVEESVREARVPAA